MTKTPKIRSLTADQRRAISHTVATIPDHGFGELGATVAEVTSVDRAIVAVSRAKAEEQDRLRRAGHKAIVPHFDAVLRKLRRLAQEQVAQATQELLAEETEPVLCAECGDDVSGEDGHPDNGCRVSGKNVAPVAAEPEASLQGALLDVLDVLSEWAQGPCPGITCSEADRLAELARVLGRPELAEALLAAHADEDEEGDEHYAPVAAEPDWAHGDSQGQRLGS